MYSPLWVVDAPSQTSTPRTGASACRLRGRQSTSWSKVGKLTDGGSCLDDVFTTLYDKKSIILLLTTTECFCRFSRWPLQDGDDQNFQPGLLKLTFSQVQMLLHWFKKLTLPTSVPEALSHMSYRLNHLALWWINAAAFQKTLLMLAWTCKLKIFVYYNKEKQ